MRGRLMRLISVAAHLHNSHRRLIQNTRRPPQHGRATHPQRQLCHQAPPGSSEHLLELDPSSKAGPSEEASDEETAKTTFRPLTMGMLALRPSRVPPVIRRKKGATPSWTAPEVVAAVSILVLRRWIQSPCTTLPSRTTVSGQGRLLGKGTPTSPKVKRAWILDPRLGKRVARYQEVVNRVLNVHQFGGNRARNNSTCQLPKQYLSNSGNLALTPVIRSPSCVKSHSSDQLVQVDQRTATLRLKYILTPRKTRRICRLLHLNEIRIRNSGTLENLQ